MAIESILNQTFKNFEFIIVEDSSTDNSNEIIGMIMVWKN
jgi:glycosyltransferase involved in cell wall biosynthesis